jgi:hypothetical protein
MSDHVHKWRATTKIFALACECGAVYHDWLKDQLAKLSAAASSSEETAKLRAELEEAKVALEKQAGEITAALAPKA